MFALLLTCFLLGDPGHFEGNGVRIADGDTITVLVDRHSFDHLRRSVEFNRQKLKETVVNTLRMLNDVEQEYFRCTGRNPRPGLSGILVYQGRRVDGVHAGAGLEIAAAPERMENKYE